MADLVDSASATPPAAIRSWWTNPYVRFVQSELWAGGAGVGVYAVFRGAAWLTELIDSRLPLQDPAATDFFAQVLAWGAVLGAAATFILITVYQLAILLKRLWQDVNDDS